MKLWGLVGSRDTPLSTQRHADESLLSLASMGSNGAKWGKIIYAMFCFLSCVFNNSSLSFLGGFNYSEIVN